MSSRRFERGHAGRCNAVSLQPVLSVERPGPATAITPPPVVVRAPLRGIYGFVQECRQYCCRLFLERWLGFSAAWLSRFLYLVVRALFGALVRSCRGLHVKDVELLVLRHELEILRRQVTRPELRMVNRALLAAAACHLPRSSRGVLLVTPRTLLRWHQGLVRRKWRQAAGQRGRPSLPAETFQMLSLFSHPPQRRVLQGAASISIDVSASTRSRARSIGRFDLK